jgi:hypothetical protein
MWYIQNSERWNLELDGLKAKGINIEIDEELEKQGHIRLSLDITNQSDISPIPEGLLPIKLIVVFPTDYPFFRPEVYGVNVDLPRHQNLVDKNLCLIPRSSSFWLPETTLAEHLTEQLPKVLAAGMIIDPELLKLQEDEQAEPVSEYYAVQPNAPVIFDTGSFDAIPESNQPIESIGTISIGFPAEAEVPCRLAILENFDTDKNSLGKIPEVMAETFSPRAVGFVYRIDKPPPYRDAEKDYKWLIGILKHPKGFPKFSHPIKLKKGCTVENVIGITFPEEHSPGTFSKGWLFLVAATIQQSKKIYGKDVKFNNKIVYYSKVNRINKDEMNIRIPSLKALASKKIVVFGLGAIGAPSVIEFAKNGLAEITIVDFDTVDAGTVVRWPLGISAVGLYKTDAIENHIKLNYPYTIIRQFRYKVGAPEIACESSQVYSTPSLNEVLLEASLIYDATAEVGVSHFLSEEAKRLEIPFISLYGTPGVWGGAVMRHIPKSNQGCWMCYQYSLRDGIIPTPPTNRDGSVQSAGCGDISFTGASFELDNIVSTGVRFAISTLCKSESGYPDIDADVGILSLIDDYGHPIFPKWTSHILQKHIDCPYCQKK